jgi:large subunit ribosomal protein L2
MNLFEQTALVRLPSQVMKVIAIYSLVMVGSVAFKEKKNLKMTKAGYWISDGKKPKVRGVAKNPIDHPHGGRTKSIRYPRTP